MIFHQAINSTNNNFNVTYYKSELFKPHFHKSLELVYVTDGHLKCNINGTEHFLYAGDYGLCLPYDTHAYEPEANTNYWICVFSEDYVYDFAKKIDNKSGSFKFNCSPSVSKFITENLFQSSVPSHFLIKALLYAVCGEYVKCATLTNKKLKVQKDIAIIVDYIEQNHTKPITLSDISHLLNYDYHYLSRYFHSLFKMSFPEMLTLYRLETAVTLLKQSNKKVIDIAFECGFQSIRSFNDCFKARFKMSPTEYRKSLEAVSEDKEK